MLSCVLCWKCQLMCRFFHFVVNIEGMRYSLPGHHCRSSQTLPYTTDPKCPAPSRHRIKAWLLSHPDLRRISAACCGYSRCPYRSDNHIPHNPPSLPAWPASPRRKCRVWQAPPSPADRPGSRCRSRSLPCWWQRKQSGSDQRDSRRIPIFHNKFCHRGTTDVAVADE